LTASLDNATCTKGVVVLDFGQPDKSTASSPYGGYGVNIFDGASTFKSDVDVVVAAVNYAQGWSDYTGSCPRLKLIIGTNNYNMIPSGNGGTEATAGANWAQVAYDVQQFLNALGYGWQIQAWSGSDMEQPSGPISDPGGHYWWDCPGATKNFVNGHLYNPNKSLLIDFGTAWYGQQNTRCTWSVADVYDVAWEPFWVYPLPEIYTHPATQSWIAVRQQGPIWFIGVMTECKQADPLPYYSCTTGPTAGENAPSGAWWSLWIGMNNDPPGQNSLDYATNIGN
jgi:hypothetical protein